jgi:uncharacterized protein YbjT (DUF2867 family)
VHREDERADALRATGAEVLAGDLTKGADVARALAGRRRLYFGMSVSAHYLEATVIAAAVARERGDLEVFVNISQMTVSQMTLVKMTDSPQHRQHLLAEQVLNWSGLPVVHVRPTVFLEHPVFMGLAAQSIARDDTIRLPFGGGRTSPVAAQDVAEAIATILANPAAHIGKVYELTGPKSQDMTGVAAEYSTALGRQITYVDVPLEQWRDRELRNLNLPESHDGSPAFSQPIRSHHARFRRDNGTAGVGRARFCCETRRSVRGKSTAWIRFRRIPKAGKKRLTGDTANVN